MQTLIATLKNTGPYGSITRQIDVLFPQLNELRRVGELMGRSEDPNEIVQSAPPGYFVVRGQCHSSFYGTELGYTCWYIKASMGYAASGLKHGHSPKSIADFLEAMMVNLDIQNLKIFPRSLPIEFGEPMASSVESGSQSPSTSESFYSLTDDGSRSIAAPSVSHESRGSNTFKDPASPTLSDSDYSGSSVSSDDEDPNGTFPQSLGHGYKVPHNTPVSSLDSNGRRTRPEDASIFAQLAERANELTRSLGSSDARSSGGRSLSRSPRRLRRPVVLAGRRRRHSR